MPGFVWVLAPPCFFFCITKSCGPCVTSKQFSTFRGARKTAPVTANTKELERVVWFSLPTHSPPMEAQGACFLGSGNDYDLRQK